MQVALTNHIDLLYWNPRRPLRLALGGYVLRRPRFVNRLKSWQRENNFGDLLGPLLVKEILTKHSDRISPPTTRLAGPAQRMDQQRQVLLAVGSILHLANDGDVVWGAGRNGKIPDDRHRFAQLDVRMVRGPKTRDFLMARGIHVLPNYGDPGLLMPSFFPQLRKWAESPTAEIRFVRHFRDIPKERGSIPTIDPQQPLWKVLEEIARSRFVVSSSLHGLVIAEALGIPARGVAARTEPRFKYADYYEGTGRSDVALADSVEEAIVMGGAPAAVFDPQSMLRSFPFDLFHSAAPLPATLANQKESES